MRTEAMHVVAESGVAAHWLYKASEPDSARHDRLGTQWLQSLLDIQHETRDAAEFWDHVKIDLFPDAVYVFTPKSQIMALPRGATVVDFAYAIHSNVGDRTVAAKINGEQVPLRTELKNGDVVEIVTAPVSDAQPGLAELRAHRPRALQDPPPPQDPGAGRIAKSWAKSCWRRPCAPKASTSFPADDAERTRPSGTSCCASPATETRAELLADIGLGKRIASIVAKRLVVAAGRKRRTSPMPC